MKLLSEALATAGVNSIVDLDKKARDTFHKTGDLKEFQPHMKTLLFTSFADDPDHDALARASVLNNSIVGAVNAFCLAPTSSNPWPSLAEDLREQFKEDGPLYNAATPIKLPVDVCAKICNVLAAILSKAERFSEDTALNGVLVDTVKPLLPSWIESGHLPLVMSAFHVVVLCTPFKFTSIFVCMVQRLVRLATTAKTPDEFAVLDAISQGMMAVAVDAADFFAAKRLENKTKDLFDVLVPVGRQLIDEKLVPPNVIANFLEINLAVLSGVEDVQQLLRTRKGLRELLFDVFASAFQAGERPAPDALWEVAKLSTHEKARIDASIPDVGCKLLSILSDMLSEDKQLLSLFESLILDHFNNSAPMDIKAPYIDLVGIVAQTQHNVLITSAKVDDILSALIKIAMNPTSTNQAQERAIVVAAALNEPFAEILTSDDVKRILSCCMTILDDPKRSNRVQASAMVLVEALFTVEANKRADMEPDDDEEMEEYEAMLAEMNEETVLFENLGGTLGTIAQQAHDSPNPMFKTAALEAIASIVQAAGKLLTPHVDDLVMLCHLLLAYEVPKDYVATQMALLTPAPTKVEEVHTELETTIAKYTQTISDGALTVSTRLAAAVGYDAFSEYAEDVVELIASKLHHLPVSDETHPNFENLIEGWDRMAKCMGDRAAPHLDVVIPKLLEVAALPLPMEELDEDCDDDEAEDDEVRSFYEPDRSTIRPVKVSKLCKSLDATFGVLRNTFSRLDEGYLQLHPFLPGIAEVALANVDHPALDGVRASSAILLHMVGDHLKNGEDGGQPVAGMERNEFCGVAITKLTGAYLHFNQFSQPPPCLYIFAQATIGILQVVPDDFDDHSNPTEEQSAVISAMISILRGGDEDGNSEDAEESDDEDDADALPLKRGRR